MFQVVAGSYFIANVSKLNDEQVAAVNTYIMFKTQIQTYGGPGVSL